MTDLTKEKLNALTEAYAGSLFVRAILENQLDIDHAGKLRIDEIEELTDNLMTIEAEKYRVLCHLLMKGSASIVQLMDTLHLSEFTVMKHIQALQNEGWLELRDTDKLIYGIKTIVKESNNHLELILVSPWTLRTSYAPITIIVESHLCCLCGACEAVCPVKAITISNDKPIIDEEKCIHCGLCNYHCPRTMMPLNVLKTYVSGPQTSFFQDLNSQAFGPSRILKSASTLKDNIKAVCQDGGMVTTFLHYLFDKNEIDGAIVVQRQPNTWNTQPIIVTNVEDLLEAAGTKYAVSSNFMALDQARQVGCKKLAFVGTPCQVQAMRKYQVYSNIFENSWGSIEYVIGIFCMETFAYENVVKISEQLCNTPITNVSKMDINKGKFFVYDLNKNPVEVPIKEVTSLARHGCHYCVDLTNELADISCGSIGSGPSWSTVVVRSEKGEKLFHSALQEKYFQIKDIPADKPFGIPLIEKLARGKRIRNFKGLRKILGETPPFYFNSLQPILKVDEE
ncbi:MAG: Coenzyme F420 hydrogenase/dehydrogenase, beta subunit C-terminal domain [Candidatus Helarchaeota archaeon]